MEFLAFAGGLLWVLGVVLAYHVKESEGRAFLAGFLGLLVVAMIAFARFDAERGMIDDAVSRGYARYACDEAKYECRDCKRSWEWLPAQAQQPSEAEAKGCTCAGVGDG